MKTKICLLVIGIFFLIPAVKAKDEFIPQASLEAVANIHVYDTKITSQNKNVFKISFDLNNAGENQDGIKYGIVLLNKETQVVWDEEVYPEIITLNKDETQRKELTYEAPNFLNGEYLLMLTCKNENGFPFGQGIAGTIKLEGNGKYIKLDSEKCFLRVEGEAEDKKYNLRQGVDITKDETLNLYCFLEDNSSLGDKIKFKAQTYNRTLFGELIKEDSGMISLKNNQLSITIPKAPKPQAYDFLITLQDEAGNDVSNNLNIHYVLSGPSATIQNATLDKDTYQKGESPKLTFNWTGSADSFPGSRLDRKADENLKLIVSTLGIKGETKNLEKVLEAYTQVKKNDITLNPLNENGIDKIKIDIVDKENNILEEIVIPIKTPQELVAEKNPSKWPIIIIVIILGVLLAILAKKIAFKGIKTLIFFFGFCLIGLGISEEARGEPLNFIRWIDAGHYYAANGSVNLNKPIYSPGENISGTFHLSIAQCNNAGPLSPIRWDTVNYASGAYSPNTLTPSGNYGYFNHTAPSTPGTYYINFGACYIVYLGAQEICIGNDSAPIFNFSFNRFISINIAYVVMNPAINGACGNARGDYIPTSTTWRAPACAAGTPDNNIITTPFLNPGETKTWNCIGSGTGHTNAPCAATRKLPVPNVVINPPVTNISLNNNSAAVSSKLVNLNWSIDNAAQACGAGCTCIASGSWSGGKTYPNNQSVTVGTPGVNNFTLTCTNPTGDPGADTSVVNANCDIFADAGVCNQPCGDGNLIRTTVDSACNIGSATMGTCNLGNCPASTDFQEVRP